MRLSRQRRFILELLWEAQEHLSAREIYDRLNFAGKDIGHTSVYQNLEALSRQGIIECIERSDGRLYGNISSSHSHINCVDTNQLLDVYVELPQEIIDRVQAETGIQIVDYQINFYGYRNAESDEGKYPPSIPTASASELKELEDEGEARSHANSNHPGGEEQ
jgi:Fur family ferric uptake transcriptional regulator